MPNPPSVISSPVNGSATVELILRSFEVEDLESYADRLRQLAESIENHTPGLKTEVIIRRQYRNLRDGLKELPQAISLAKQAFDNLGRSYTEAIIRGGTDGSQLTYGRAAKREVLGKFVSSILLGIGYLMVAFDSQKQGLHDKIADTYVIKL